MNDTKYSHRDIEKKWSEYWGGTTVYAWDKNESHDNSYIIDTPPPTVSGYLHIGHVYSYTQTDLIARFMRMSGRNVFYPMGFDDNGLPTERLVEKTKHVRASDMSREAFVELCHEVVDGAEKDFRALFKQIGLSVDWDQEYRTVSADSIKISQMSTLDLFYKNQLYRNLQPTLWDSVDQTALAQAEVVEREVLGNMWHVAFDLESGGEAVIATTRPELLGACAALLIHPDDPRSAELVRQRVAISPLFGVPIPILTDMRVDPKKGTGIVMCCTFGDTTDIEWWRDHTLPTRVIVDRNGRLTTMVGLGGPDWPSHDIHTAKSIAAQLSGLKIHAAREKIVDILKSRDLIRGNVSIQHMVPCAERSSSPLEILVTPQWFVRVIDKKDKLIERGKDIRWVPDYMRIRYERWVENLKWDWCVSRQRFFGVPFPFWYSKRPGEEGRIIAAHVDDLPVNPLVDLPRGYSADEVEPDPDVMDTWATSSVSPQINSRGIAPGFAIDPNRHNKLFPASLRPQAHEIIRTWAFYTILKAHLHSNQVPWRDIAISGWCLAQDRSKMSKSKGNIVTPESLLDRYGADVVRYWTATSRLGLDTALSEDTLKVGKRLVTKLWNAARFVGMQLESFTGEPTSPREDVAHGKIHHAMDLWILGQLSETVAAATKLYEAYEYADALQLIERFFWNDLCDNYLEIVKGRAYGDFNDPRGRESAQYALWHSLETVLRLLAPTVPFVTEEIYSFAYRQRFALVGSIHARGQWPRHSQQVDDPFAARAGSMGVQILASVRKAKSDRQISLKAPVRSCQVANGPTPVADAREAFESVRDDLRYAAAAVEMIWVDTLDSDATVTADGACKLELQL